jgi:hypothetical protein
LRVKVRPLRHPSSLKKFQQNTPVSSPDDPGA